MSIQDEARAAADEYARHHIGGMQPVETLGDRVRAAFEAGAVWRDEQADREPSDAEVIGAAREYHERGNGEGSFERMADHVRDSLIFRMRAALLAAQEVRRGD